MKTAVLHPELHDTSYKGCYILLLCGDGLVAKSCLTLATTWTATLQASLSTEFSSQEYWNGLPFPSPGHLPDPGMEAASPAFAGRFFTAEPPESQELL